MRNFFLLIINAFLLLGVPQLVSAQTEVERTAETEVSSLLPLKNGDKKKYSVYIEIKKAYISGICIMIYDDAEIKGSIFNEFGVSAMDFSYRMQKDKVKLHHVFKPLDRWFIRRMIRKNLLALIHNMQQGIPEYADTRRHITYKLKRIN